MLSPVGVRSPMLRRRARHQQPYIAAVKGEHARRYAVVPLLAVEPVGARELRALCHPVHPEEMAVG